MQVSICICVDPLEWWRTQTETYRGLSHLARAVLAIPATSAPSERIFFSRWCDAKLQTKLIVTSRRWQSNLCLRKRSFVRRRV